MKLKEISRWSRGKVGGETVRIREYSVGTHVYILEKTLNGHGGYYILKRGGQQNKGIGKGSSIIYVEGMKVWGHGLTWKQAIAKVEKRIFGIMRLAEKFNKGRYN